MEATGGVEQECRTNRRGRQSGTGAPGKPGCRTGSSAVVGTDPAADRLQGRDSRGAADLHARDPGRQVGRERDRPTLGRLTDLRHTRLDLAAGFFLAQEPYATGVAPIATRISRAGEPVRLALGYPAASINVLLTLDQEGRISEETLTDDSHLIHRRFVYPGHE